MMAIIENIIDQYYFYSTEILQCFSGIFIIVAICGFIYTFIDDISSCLKDFIELIKNKTHAVKNEELHPKTSKKRINYNINSLIYKGIYSVIVAGMGTLLCQMGAKLEIEYVYFNAVVFMFIVGATIAYGILLCLMFRQILLPMQQSCRYIQFFIFVELFLLAVTQHLDVLEWVTATLGIISAEVMTKLLEKLILKQKRKKEKKKNKGYDYPDPDLYPTRKKQLERFIAVLKEQRYEPYAVMISGEWGKGKTSFVKALEKALEESCFVWVHTGSEKNVTEIMAEISAQIVEVLKENNIFLERKDLIEKYFLTFSDLLEDTALKPLKKIVGAVLNKKTADEREYLNSKLDELDRVIYLVIDDLDRCSDEYQEKMFKVIRESTKLHNCKTIFLVDKTKFLTKEQGTNYIEKYVNYILDLCEVDYFEIVERVIKDILSDEFIQNMNPVLLRNRSVDQIRDMVYKYPTHLIEKIENEISKEKNQRNKNDQKIEELEQTILRIKKEVTIPRKAKNYLKGIKRDVGAFVNAIDMIGGELIEEDWFGTIIKVQYVKNFMPEVFNEIKMNRNIYEFCKKNSEYTVNIIFDLKFGGLLHNEKQETLLNLIIYNIDIIDFSQVRTIREKCLQELHNDQATAIHIKEYIDFAETYDDLKKIVNIYKSGNQIYKDSFIEMIFKPLSQRYSPFCTNTKEFLDFSKQLMNCLIEKGMSSNEIELCKRKAYLIVERVIADNLNLFLNILGILFNITSIENSLRFTSVDDIFSLYDVITRIDPESKYKGLNDDKNKLMSIKKYYENLSMELKSETYKDVGVDFDALFSRVRIVLEICEFWDNIECIIDTSSWKTEEIFRKYFALKDGYIVFEETFIDASSLLEALATLREFYLTNENNYKSDYSLLLLKLSYRLLLIYEEDSTRFKDMNAEIIELLRKNKELVCKLDKGTNDYEQDTLNKIKIYVYKINIYCKDGISVETENTE